MIGDVTNSDGSTKVSLSCHAKIQSWKRLYFDTRQPQLTFERLRVSVSWVPVAGWQISNTYPLFGRWEGSNWLRPSQHEEELKDLHANLPILLEDMRGTCQDKGGKCGVQEGDCSNELWIKCCTGIHTTQRPATQKLVIQAPQSNTNFPRCPVQPSWDRIWHPRLHLEDKHIPRPCVYLWPAGDCGRARQGTCAWSQFSASFLWHHFQAWWFLCLPTDISPHTLQGDTLHSSNVPDPWTQICRNTPGNVQGVCKTHSLFKEG